MPDTIRSLTGCAVLAASFIVAAAPHVAAQLPLAPQVPQAETPAAPAFMPRYDFHMSAASLASPDPRFSWDIHFGGEFDLVDYVHGRATFLADYQTVLGNEYRAFDPNQGTYTLAASSSVRVHGLEIAGLIHHVSRHVSDRPKREAIAWNVLAGRVLKRLTFGPTTVDVGGDAGKVIARAYVDYDWTVNADVTLRRPVSPIVGLFVAGAGHLIGTIPAIAGRNGEQGGRIEAGARINGRGGALELFAGYEQVIDAAPFERKPESWTFAGFRLVRD